MTSAGPLAPPWMYRPRHCLERDLASGFKLRCHRRCTKSLALSFHGFSFERFGLARSAAITPSLAELPPLRPRFTCRYTGGVCVSNDTTHRQIRGKVDFAFDDISPRTLKNIAEPTPVWRVRIAARVVLQ